MESVRIRDLKIGEGIPKICVPIVGRTVQEILEETNAIKEIPKDLVEWRADWYEDVFEIEKVRAMLDRLREALGNVPLLFTFRTANEGGERDIDKEAYLALNQSAAKSGNVDMLDVEIFFDEDIVKSIIASAHENNVKVIASNHDFQKTPPREEIVKRLLKMQEMQADVLKIAVMPKTKKDVITLLAATEEMVTDYAKQPVVTMSMSNMGVFSRLSGEAFGSAITFGSAKKTSAPGQIPAKQLQMILEQIHCCLK